MLLLEGARLRSGGLGTHALLPLVDENRAIVLRLQRWLVVHGVSQLSNDV